MLKVHWSDRIEDLADRLLDDLGGEPLSDPLKTELVVVPTPALGGWLRHHALLDRRRSFTNVETPLLFNFVNDWLHRMNPERAGEDREPRFHPYSKQCLRWRLHRRLLAATAADDPVFAPLRDYVGSDRSPRRFFALAGEIAGVVADYQVYRPDLLVAWESGDDASLDEKNRWQAALWRGLVAENPNSVVADFLSMEKGLPRCGFAEELERLSVFGLSSAPPVFLQFLHLASQLIPVRLYAFNPCAEYWFEDLEEKRTAMVGREESEEQFLETGNPLLSSLGKPCQDFCREVMDRVEDVAGLSRFEADDASVLRSVQTDVRLRRWIDDAGGASRRDPLPVNEADDSLSFAICHHPRRELEALRDQLLRWFETDSDLRPMDVQVLAPRIDLYAPYVEAVFETSSAEASDSIPFVISDRPGGGVNQVSAAFSAILGLPEKRFTAAEVVDILECPAVSRRHNLAENDLPVLDHLINEAGIRWGIDADHREEISGCRFEASTSWRRGLDRMLLGMAMGRIGENERSVVEVGSLGEIAPLDSVESQTAELAGKLAAFFDKLVRTTATLRRERPLAEWEETLCQVIDDFFVADAETYRDLSSVRAIVAGLARGGEKAGVGDESISLEVVARYVDDELEQSRARGALVKNAVVFSSLVPGACAPRKIICLLGMNDGDFPRSDERPLFDLIRISPRRCDPSNRFADREAFLEALLAARRRLRVSHIGRGERDNEPKPASTVVRELIDYLEAGFILPEKRTTWDGSTNLWRETTHHLQAFHPDYFARDDERSGAAGLFSYSLSDCAAANALVRRRRAESAAPARACPPSFDARLAEAEASEAPLELSIDELVGFFKNPAKSYYRRSLGVSFDDYDQVTFADAEPFELDNLGGYDVDQYLIQFLLDSDPSSHEEAARDATVSLKESGRVPLGKLGEEELAKRTRTIEAFLDATVSAPSPPVQGSTLRAALRMEKTPAHVELSLGGVRILGGGSYLDLGDHRVALHFRYANLKAKDFLGGWIRHLIDNATGAPTETLVVGKKNKKLNTVSFAAFDEIEAVKRLAVALAVVRLGLREPIPFAPATSFDYWQRLVFDDAYDLEDPASRRDALEKALPQWDGYHGFECQDPHLTEAFDGLPPWEWASPEEFHQCAKSICQPPLATLGSKPL